MAALPSGQLEQVLELSPDNAVDFTFQAEVRGGATGGWVAASWGAHLTRHVRAKGTTHRITPYPVWNVWTWAVSSLPSLCIKVTCHSVSYYSVLPQELGKVDPEPGGGPGAAPPPPERSDPPLGWRQARQALIATGACSLVASEAWVANHYRWIVWKLAAHTRVLLTTPRLQQQRGDGGALHLPPEIAADSVKAATDAGAESCVEAVGNRTEAAGGSKAVSPPSAGPDPHLAGLAWYEVVAQLQHRWAVPSAGKAGNRETVKNRMLSTHLLPPLPC